MSARDLTLPGLTARYFSLLNSIGYHYNRKVIIVVDELDKISDTDQVKALLTEIKGALFAKGSFYLISISEDAARSFRYRLTTGRDIFESTFDEIIEVRQMNVEAACAMMLNREKNLDESTRIGEECMPVIALFAGGIPREIIRGLRTLSFSLRNNSKPTPNWAAQKLLHYEIDEWIYHIGETNLSGEDTVKLRAIATDILATLSNIKKSETPNYSKLMVGLEHCLTTIDPNSLRHSVSFVFGALMMSESQSNKSSGLDDQSMYLSISKDIQACIRLMILTTIAELTEKTGNTWESYDSDILECYHVLSDKPVLAQALLSELRDRHISRGV